MTDAAETVVQETKIGKVSEALGVKVGADIHHNGLNTTVKGPVAFVASAGQATELKGSAKVKTSGGDFGAKGAAEAKDGDVTIAARGGWGGS